MIVFSAVDGFCNISVVLPDGHAILSTIHFGHLGKDLLCMLLRKEDSVVSNYYARYEGMLVPFLSNHSALPYKRYPSLDQLDHYTFNLKTKCLGMPLSSDYVNLDEIKNFHRGCKKYYVAVAFGPDISDAGGEPSEAALILFDRYSDAIGLLRYFPKSRIRRILGDRFKLYNGWYPYIRVDYMNHPISLLGKISSHVGTYSVGGYWCYYLVCLLRDGLISYKSLTGYFDFIHRDKFDKIVHYDANEELSLL